MWYHGGWSDWFKLWTDVASISIEVSQGGILSHVLSNIFVSDQPTPLNTSVTDYSVDKVFILYMYIIVYFKTIIITMNDDPLMNSTNLQTDMDPKRDWSTEWKFNMNHSKSIHITFYSETCSFIWGSSQRRFDSFLFYFGLKLDQRLI